MKIVPVYETLENEPTVTSLLGVPPGLRVYEFGQAPAGVARPYLTWQEITGFPDNTLGCPPGYDTKTIQLDVFAEDANKARATRDAVVNAIEKTMYVTSFDGEGKDPPTNYYRVTFSVDWFVKR